MEAKFTPGPWKVGPVDDTLVATANGNEVAQICGDYNQSETWPVMEANARLIAAAPDLYTALSLFVEYNELMEAGADVAGMLKYAELMDAAPKALAKARGENPAT